MDLRKIANNIKKKIQIKNNNNYKKKDITFIRNNDIILCKYWIIDKYKYRICWFGGICTKPKKKEHLTYVIVRNMVWNVRIINYFFLYSPSLLQIFLKKSIGKRKKN